MLKTDDIQITTELPTLLSKIDEFNGGWRGISN
jgi:hypothetical protein